jgi:hypothetical protein
MFVMGTLETRAKGRHWIKVEYDSEMQMSVLEIGDEVISAKVYLPTNKLAELLADAFEIQANDPHAIGHEDWMEERVGGHKRPVTLPKRLSHI